MTQNIAIETSGSKTRGSNGRPYKSYDPNPNKLIIKSFNFFRTAEPNQGDHPCRFWIFLADLGMQVLVDCRCGDWCRFCGDELGLVFSGVGIWPGFENLNSLG